MQDTDQNYSAQDRGSESDYIQYLASMDKVIVEKVASASVFFDPAPGNLIVDIGMASGTSTDILAHLFPGNKIIGVDINPKMVEFASNTYKAANLEFRVDDGEKLTTFQENSANGFFNCSSIHHITSFNGYDSNRARNTIKRQVKLLKEGGVIVIRDFVKPPEMEVIIELSDISGDKRPSDAELIYSFSKTARSLSGMNERGFPLREIAGIHKNTRRFRLFLSDAVEFIRRKDYYDNWEVELQEEYGYYTQEEFEEVFAGLGLRTIISYPVYNSWIVKNRYRHKFNLYDKNFTDIGFPPTNFLIAGEKVKDRGTKIRKVRHLPETENSFLKYSSYLDTKTSTIYDIVQRPNSVVDIIPYFCDNGQIEILAKHGYPRPIINIETDSPVIDSKHYSGYITESITAASSKPVKSILAERANIEPGQIAKIEDSLEYFTSPGGIDEKIKAILVELKSLPVENQIAQKNYSGFNESGSIRKYSAIQLLKTAQTGALVEARLELNLYRLLRSRHIDLPAWLGERIELEESPQLNIIRYSEIQTKQDKSFIPSENIAGFLSKHKAKFTETGIQESSNILEYVLPQGKSINTLITLPVAKHNKEIYVGLELRRLPVPQIQTGNSVIPVVPACRLPKDIKTFKELEKYISETPILGQKVKHYTKLGEKFYPSVGLTPEQVYPYVVSIELTSEMQWISLKEIYSNMENLRDGHLLICLMRLMHSMGI